MDPSSSFPLVTSSLSRGQYRNQAIDRGSICACGVLCLLCYVCEHHRGQGWALFHHHEDLILSYPPAFS